ncbi:MAG TPA: methylmalonyl Co-A mutase-associated GTPase MeaB [Robiginitalea sp.]|nr:methylmalonyl Co-A mutase-associated GTPase MeaB [Robiginitalea sp.]
MPSDNKHPTGQRPAARPSQAGWEALLEGILEGNRTALARAITLIESRRPSDSRAAGQIVEGCLPHAGRSIRIGITGVPGAGKSTFIERLGLLLVQKGHRVAVLAVDPSSSLSKGSILGDKTRMQQLSRAEQAFIRPSPAGDTLGGVARKTRESISLCEAAGYDIVLIETVGVGQSETAVHGMVDFFLLLKITGAGDELQGIKRGIVEMADAIVINKAEGANLQAAREARGIFENALQLYPPKPGGWIPKVLLCSSTEGTGFEEIWSLISGFRESASASGLLASERAGQNLQWFRQAVDEGLLAGFYERAGVRETYERLREAVRTGSMSPFRAAEELLGHWGSQPA